jgi:NADH-quinone oxidoreductase subunit F
MLERLIRGEATPIDLETIASVQRNIIGNCLCVLGDSMAAPVGSMVEKFRQEFDEAIERGVPGAHVGPAASGAEIVPPGIGEPPMPAKSGAVA